MSSDGRHLYQFGPFRLNPRQRLLSKDGHPIPLQPKAFDTLLALVQDSDKIVLKEDLLKAVWPGTFVEESNLTQNISVLRKALGDTAGEHRYIATIPGRGYQFTMVVRNIDQAEAMVEESATPQGGQASPASSAPASPSRSASIRWLAAVAAAILLAGGWVAWRGLSLRRAEVPGRIMLAVLPFQNLSGDPEQEYFADGLTEEIITQLGRIQPEQLVVIARTSVMPYKHTEKRLDQIGRELAVQYVLEGSFRRSADRLRITAQLIQVKDQSHLWAEEYDRRPEDMVLIQGDVGTAVAQQIQRRLRPQQNASLTHFHRADPAAFEEFLKGRYFFNQRSKEGLEKAIAYFQLAIGKDPAYGQAHAAQAAAYAGLAFYGFEAPNEVLPRANTAARTALAMDDQLSDAFASLGLIAEQYDRNWPESERNYKQAIRLNPSDSLTHNIYASTYLGPAGRFDEGLVELGIAHQLDPLSPIITTALGAMLAFTGRWDEGMEQFRKTFEITPDFVQAHYYLTQVYVWKKSYPEALAEVEKIIPSDSAPAIGLRGYVYALQDRKSDALLVADRLRKMSETSYVDPTFIANIYSSLGDKDAAFVWLEKAYEQHSEGMITLKGNPAYDKIRSDPHFVDLVRREGIP